MIIPRMLAGPLSEALADTPVVLITGARQTGKTTLARELAGTGTYRTLDDAATRAAAAADPDGFVQGARPFIIDEVQRAPDLLLAVKAAVDRDRQPGSFVLTGSADVMTLPKVSESLAGRIEIHTLRPLSAAELAGEPSSFVDLLHGTDAPASAPAIPRAALIELLLRGGFPEARLRTAPRREAWMRDYLETVVQREVPTIADIQYADQLPRLLRIIATGAPGMLNISALSSAVGVPRTTIDRYLAVIRQVFLLNLLTPWHVNIATRQVKSLRTLLCDSGLHAHLLELDAARLADWQPEKVGALLETFVGCELVSQRGWSKGSYQVHWWRTGTGVEVDFVVESRAGTIVGVEVKSAATVRQEDFRGLRQLQGALGERFHRGIVLYTGSEVLSFGDGLEAWPITSIWGGRPIPSG